jgi:uncharacterized membrane protein
MDHLLGIVVANVATVIQVIAVVIVAYAALQALVHSVRVMFGPAMRHRADFEAGYVRFARWLIVALTFQLAADIVQTTFAPTWEELGKLAAIAAIRAFINYFLEHDLEQHERARRLDGASSPGGAPGSGAAETHAP